MFTQNLNVLILKDLKYLFAYTVPLSVYAPEDLRDRICAGERPFVPDDPQICPERVQQLMVRCWDANAANRPRMAEVLVQMQDAQDNPPPPSQMALLDMAGGDALDGLM